MATLDDNGVKDGADFFYHLAALASMQLSRRSHYLLGWCCGYPTKTFVLRSQALISTKDNAELGDSANQKEP